MSEYYNPQRGRNLYIPGSLEPFKISRSKIELFVQCRRCFYLDRRLGVSRPPGFPFALNTAVDTLLKQEFDFHRDQGSKHPLMEKYGIDAIPAQHEEINAWRQNFTGIQFHHEPTNLLVFGAIDDLWQNSSGEYIIVDYKATSKKEEITALDQAWQDGYKRQMEVYQWLLRQKGYQVSNTGYFVYCNASTDRSAFDGKLEFAITLIPYTGNDDWIEGALKNIHDCLNADQIPVESADCDYCSYREAAGKAIESKVQNIA